MELPVNYKELNWQERKLVREQYIINQNGLCFYCKRSLTGKPSREVQNKWLNLKLFPPNFLKHNVHLHHCHDTGMTIGAVHAKCNGILWQYEGE